MIADYILITILVLYPIALKVLGKGPSRIYKPKKVIYTRKILESLAFLLLVFLLDPTTYNKVDFTKVGKGIVIDIGIFTGLMTIFIMPLISIFILKKNYARTIGNSTEIFGCPIEIVPANYRELSLFTLCLIIGVIFEELFFRQFTFYAFYKTLGIKGDISLLISSVLFTIGHHYKKFSDLLGVFITGLLLGKAFQLTGSILVPIIYHFFLNSTVLVLAWKRINKDQPIKSSLK